MDEILVEEAEPRAPWSRLRKGPACACGGAAAAAGGDCGRWCCAPCLQLTQADVAARAEDVWCPDCQEAEFERAQRVVDQGSAREAVERCLGGRARVLLTDPPTPHSTDEVLRRMRRLHCFLHVEPYADAVGATRYMVIGKDHGVDAFDAWKGVSLIAGYLLNLPIWVDPLDERVMERIERARRPHESYGAAMRRLRRWRPRQCDECYVVPTFAHDVDDDKVVIPKDQPLVKCMCNKLISHVLVRRWGVFDFTTGQRCNSLTSEHAPDEQPAAKSTACMLAILNAIGDSHVGRRDRRFVQRRASGARRFVR
jgi:hypothetical protein